MVNQGMILIGVVIIVIGTFMMGQRYINMKNLTKRLSTGNTYTYLSILLVLAGTWLIYTSLSNQECYQYAETEDKNKREMYVN